MNRKDIQFFCLDTRDNLIYDKDGILLNKEHCSKLIEVLKNESSFNQRDIETLRRKFSLEVLFGCASHRIKRNRKGEVYFAQLSNGLIKIGCSDNSKARVRDLKQEFGNIKLLFYIKVPDKYYYESLMHFIFKRYNITRELFDFSNTNTDKLVKSLLNLFKSDCDIEEIIEFIIDNDLDK